MKRSLRPLALFTAALTCAELFTGCASVRRDDKTKDTRSYELVEVVGSRIRQKVYAGEAPPPTMAPVGMTGPHSGAVTTNQNQSAAIGVKPGAGSASYVGARGGG
ncbi:hypothetical protein [Synoicihabitans lomoniglobus]|uniref:Lipoprotein n=1 Tax=Synoicihabitans lomoniglobus TaxID=2909285 RepID=A0AAF0I5L0_9BACT|nr:hypothetical protein [Opitutaceae bacterium LMO-M01]WED67095.1 hypothetical protein PXH66_09550 [Opitutaceae bacterium LMO-M01]